MVTKNDDTLRLLDSVHDELSAGAVGSAMNRLYSGLFDVRSSTSREEWRAFAEEVAPRHPVRQLIHEDPMTRRSFEKPRGYAGDAVLLDYIYGLRAPEAPSHVGQSVFDYAFGRGSARAVRHRREWLAHCLDDAGNSAPGAARVLSIACGHLREMEQSAAVRSGLLEEIVALDADAASLEVAALARPGLVKTVPLSVGRLLARGERMGRFHFVYSAGLYDYLDERLARDLTAKLFSMLEPGGRLLFSNFLPGVSDAGYMETFMGWELIERDLDAIEAIGDGIDEEEIASRRAYPDPYGVFGYLELVRG